MPSTTLPVAGYERIRVVGKGSFGSAILYRRNEDDALVVLKEINMHELSPNERQLALNEVSLLSRLNHPHIISYYDSFAHDGILMIAMEYADGGTLAQLLARREDFLPEAEIVELFEQMISAVSYLHDNNVLHRDLKTANIFLMKENLVKIGDFGISKIMGTQTQFQGAQTILGTPYYLSPEMCEGKPYAEKSDIWSLGCCLYEMSCLQKPFDGVSLPALVNRIVHVSSLSEIFKEKAEYEQVKGPYSDELKLLIREMLKTNPDLRPSASDVLTSVQRNRHLRNRKTQRPDFGNTVRPPVCHSALYEFHIESVSLSVIPTSPNRLNIKQLAIGGNHFILLAADSEVFSWGENGNGQLGHGDREQRTEPQRIAALCGRNVQRVAAGGSFSLFCGDHGIVMICGNGSFGGRFFGSEDLLIPRLLDGLLRENVVDISCGDEHIAAVTEEGTVFVWGNGSDGRLGIPGCAVFVASPQKLEIPTKQLISNVRCGPDCTALITRSGALIVMGSNKDNKLNLNYRMGVFANVKPTKTDIVTIDRPTPMKAFPSRVVDAAFGRNHSGVLLENGHIHLFGRNQMGELGTGSRQPAAIWMAYRPVKALSSKVCVQLICGDGFTMAATSDNELYFWGAKTVSAETDPNRPKSSRRLFNWRRLPDGDPNSEIAISQPTLVMRLDSAKTSNGKRPFIRLSTLVSSVRTVLVSIDTSPILLESAIVPSSTLTEDRRRSAPEFSAASTTATWIRREVAEADRTQIVSSLQFHQNETQKSPNKEAEAELKKEIDQLKAELQHQNHTFRGHQNQMETLQRKLSELQSLQNAVLSNEPPPAYETKRPHTLLRNPFLPNEGRTRVCGVL